MNKVWMNVLSALFSLAAFAFVQTTSVDWDPGGCSPIPNPSGTVPCIEHKDSNGDWWHFNGGGGHAGVWHGCPVNEDGDQPEEPFSFCGVSSMSCVVSGQTVELDCNLCLDSEFKKFQDGTGDWLVGVKLVDGDASSGDQDCNDISLGGFTWFAGPGTTHNNFDNTSGISYAGSSLPGTFTGNFGGVSSAGNSIDITYAGFVTLVDEGYVHGVDFNNNGGGAVRSDLYFGLASTSMDAVIYENGGDSLQLHYKRDTRCPKSNSGYQYLVILTLSGPSAAVSWPLPKGGAPPSEWWLPYYLYIAGVTEIATPPQRVRGTTAPLRLARCCDHGE